MIATTMKRRIGASLAMVVTMLTNAACLMPLSTRMWISHRQTDAPMIDGKLLPPPKTGKKWDSAEKIATA